MHHQHTANSSPYITLATASIATSILSNPPKQHTQMHGDFSLHAFNQATLRGPPTLVKKNSEQTSKYSPDWRSLNFTALCQIQSCAPQRPVACYCSISHQESDLTSMSWPPRSQEHVNGLPQLPFIQLSILTSWVNTPSVLCSSFANARLWTTSSYFFTAS